MKQDSKPDPSKNHERAPLQRESIFDRKLQQWRNTGDFPKAARTLINRGTGETTKITMERQVATVAAADVTELEKAAFLDPLTESYNERTIRSNLKEEIRRARRYKQSLGVLVVEVDKLQESAQGASAIALEAAIKYASELIAKNIREVDILGRFEDGKFLILAPETSMNQLSILADRIRHLLATSRIANIGERLPLTVSAGIGSYPESGDSDEAVMKSAVDALRLAIESGGDASAWAEPVARQENEESKEFTPDLLS